MIKNLISTDAIIDPADAFLAEVASENRVSPKGDEFKTVLLHTISHELRTPLSVIQSSAELLVLLQQHLTSPERHLIAGHAQHILKEISTVTDLINRMVLFSRWELGDMPPLAEPTDIQTATLDAIAASFSPWSDGRNIELKVTGQPRLVRMDPVLFQLILKNLLENACKYSGGKRAPEARLRFQASGWSVSVKDFGIGIPAADLERLFQPFARGSNVGHTPGMGLGLRIAHYLVNNFSGVLGVESKEGRGTTATATFLYR